MNKEALMKLAHRAKEHSYSPYSHFRVGAAVLTVEGHVYTGCNVENASYTPSCCAERVALYQAISQGEKNISAIAIAADRKSVFPCGVCRQVIAELAPHANIYVEEEDGIGVYTLEELFPHEFGAKDLEEVCLDQDLLR